MGTRQYFFIRSESGAEGKMTQERGLALEEFQGQEPNTPNDLRPERPDVSLHASMITSPD